jgi:putative transcriptional regulator
VDAAKADGHGFRCHGRHGDPVRKEAVIVTMHAFGHPQQAEPLDALLASYAAGRLNRPMHALIDAHLGINPRNRSYVSALEAVVARQIEEEAGVALRRRDAMLSAILGSAVPAQPAAVRQLRPAVDVLPAALRGYIGHSLGDVPWRTVMPGVREFHVEGEAGEDATLYWIRAGKAMPSHTHDGAEVTLVLQGGFTDLTGHYRRGDVAVADHELDHKPVADDDADCICFAVTDAPLRLTGPVGRIVQKLFRN